LVVTRCQIVIGQREVWMIENVEKLCSKLQVEPFPDLCVLGNGKINISVAVPENRVPAKIAERAVRRLTEGKGVQISGDRCPMRQDGIDSRYYVRPLIEVEMAAIVERVRDRNRPPALDTDNCIQLPTRAKFSDPMKCGNIIIEGCGETMSSIKEGVPAFRLQVARILRKRSTRYKVDAVGSIIDGVGPDIAREARKAMRILQTDNRLQRMIDRRSPREEFINRVVIGVGKEFVEVRQAHQLGSLTTDVTDLYGCVFRESLLNIQIPILAVRTGKFPRSHKNRIGSGRVDRQDRSRGIGVGAVESRG